MKKTIWDIKKGDIYWNISPVGCVFSDVWENSISERLKREFLNVFLTKEEAEAELEARKKKAQALKPNLYEADSKVNGRS